MRSIIGFLGLCRRLFGRLVIGMNSVGSVIIFLMMLLITLDISMRYLFNSPISGVTEMTEIGIVVVLYMQLAHTLKVGRITRSDALFTTLTRRTPHLANLLDFLFNVAGSGLMLAIVWGGWPKFIQAYETGTYVGNLGVFTFPEWPKRLVLVFGCAVLGIEFALKIVDNVRFVFGLKPLEEEAAVDVETEVIEESLRGEHK